MKLRTLGVGLAVVSTVLLAGCVPPKLTDPPFSVLQSDPVVFVNGAHEGNNFQVIESAMQQSTAWSSYSTMAGFYQPSLGVEDRCVHAIATDVAVQIDQIRQQTGHDKVDLVGYSLGGLIVRDLLVNLDVASKVDDVVLLASPNEGTVFLESPGETDCWSRDIRPDSPFLETIAVTPDPPADGKWWNVYADGDGVILRHCAPPLTGDCAYEPVLGTPWVNHKVVVAGAPPLRHLAISKTQLAIDKLGEALYDPSP